MSLSWKNWSRSVKVNPEQIAYPANEEELAQLIRECAETGKTPRVAGSGHSFTALMADATVVISLDKMTGLIDVDPEARTATAWAGTRLKDLGEMLHTHGLAMENLGDIDVQSLAGAISTGTHGTGTAFGTIATQVIGLTLVTARGEILTCSEGMYPEIFKAAQVSLGSLGIITRITLRLKPAYKLKYVSKKEKLGDVLDRLEQYKRRNRNFEFYWFPYTDTVQTKEMNLTDESPKKHGIGKWFNDIFLENGVFGLLSNISRFIPGTSAAMSKVTAWGAGTSSDVSWSHQVFATPRYVKFQEMEYNVPTEHFATVLQEIAAMIHAQKVRVHFPIECRWVTADDIWLSPAYQRESAYIAVHMFKGMPHRAYFDAVETIVKKYGGRPHWGKMHFQSPAELAQLYPKWEDFHRIRRELDPEGVFLNPYLRKLFGEVRMPTPAP